MKKGFQIVQNHAGQQGESILPMINVVFLMLIFFMVAGVITTPDLFQVLPAHSRVNLPYEQTEQTIYIDEKGIPGFHGQMLSMNLLQEKLSVMSGQELAIPMQIKADRNAPSGSLIEVMEMLRESGFTQTLLITSRDQVE